MMLPHSEQVGASVADALKAVPAWPPLEDGAPNAAEGEGATSAVSTCEPFETMLLASLLS